MKFAFLISYLLVVLGGLNLFAVGIYNVNIIEFLFGQGSMITRIIYTLVGFGANFMFGFLFIYKPYKTIAK